MPYSFTKIEEDKTRTIGFVFSFLIFFYFISFWLIIVLIKNFYLYQSYPSSDSFSFSFLGIFDTLIIMAIALVIGYCHWSYTTSNLVPKIIGVLKAEKLNEKDHYHKMFQNIIDEVSVATGGKKIQGVVIPTMAMNAFALADFKGNAVIGTTEGVLARLTRPQIEAIVGHEAAHIVTGDCLSTTVTSSLFELYSSLLSGLQIMLRGSGRQRYSSRGSGGVLAIILLIYILLSVTKFMSHLVRMFISRQREYRADAVAVRLTRDPLSLAEALYAIAFRWRGAGLAAQELEAIFIVNPVFSAVDESAGLGAEMFSTHPPVENRLNILLNMAHADVDLVIKEVERKSNQQKAPVPEVSPVQAQWMVSKNGAWQGPFDPVKIATFDWIRPETWIQRVGDGSVKMAYEDLNLMGFINKGAGEPGHYNCPKCKIALNTLVYEGVEVDKCSFCHGVFVTEKDVQRIIIRQEVGFSERIHKIAEGIKQEEYIWKNAKIKRDPDSLYQCPNCRHKKSRMMRMFFTAAYQVEVDKCIYCGLIWFDKDELEVLQCLIEKNVKANN